MNKDVEQYVEEFLSKTNDTKILRNWDWESVIKSWTNGDLLTIG